MADTDFSADMAEGEEKKKSKATLFALIGAVLLGGGAFYATYSGLLPIGGGSEVAEPAKHEPVVEPMPDVAFVPLEKLVISLGSTARARHLRFSAELEVVSQYKEDVDILKPRILDVLNTFLRAVDEKELADPVALLKLRAQMLRRIQIVTGEGRVRNLLITEFVLN